MHRRSSATVLGAALLLGSPALAQAPSSKAAAIPGLPFSEPQTVAEFMKGVESDTTGLYFVALADPHPRKAETFLRAAQKQAPSRQPWAAMVDVLFDTERSNAARLPAAARTAVFQHAVTYLQEWHDLTAAALKNAPADKQLAEILPLLKSDLAVAALEAGQLDAARKHATEALAANTDTKNWNYGNVVDAMNQVLGRAALRQGNRDEARRALLAAGATPGSPQLNSYGPTFVLAREMLGKGEKDVVLQYLDSVGNFWGHDDPKRPQHSRLAAEQAALLVKWKREIREGKIPTDVNWR
jgi:tetratricopeptide (TPR) repeat protein